nr:NFACT RNA binding domain-containing protein [Clostridia bacterium]
GRNNTDNDRLTFGFSEAYDIWLHIKNMHGSHVIVKNKEQTEQFVPDKTLTEAAMVAAFHSEGKDSGQVAVDYTFAKNVKKPKGSKPGYVNYFNYYSAYVKADKEAVEKLRKS